MDQRRAQEIVTLPNMVNVTYNDTPVYIESVHDDKVRIHPLNQPQDVQEVSVSSLIEH